MNTDPEFEQSISEMTLEELQESKELFAQLYARICREILERTATPTSSTTPARLRFNLN